MFTEYYCQIVMYVFIYGQYERGINHVIPIMTRYVLIFWVMYSTDIEVNPKYKASYHLVFLSMWCSIYRYFMVSFSRLV